MVRDLTRSILQLRQLDSRYGAMLKVDVLKDAMHSPVETKARSKEIARSLERYADLRLFRQHLREVIEGPPFRGSYCSAQFLKYIVDQAIACQTAASSTFARR